MMGRELCINAILAFASTLKKKGRVYASGINKPIKYENKENKTTIKIPLKYKQQGNIILFKGIGFKITNNKTDKKSVKKLSEKYNLPAFGIINYSKNKISPYVYVKKVNSFVKETACGSGSIAFSIFSGFKSIIQPTGKPIYVEINKKFIEVSSKVSELNSWRLE